MSGTTPGKPIAGKPVSNGAKSEDKTVSTAPNAEDKPVATTPKSADTSAPAPRAAAPSPSASSSPRPSPLASSSPVASASPAQRTLKCPKCGTDVREVARFCPRCHHTMRYECPSCHHQQRAGGQCEKCGVDFMKYLAAVMSQKQAELDAQRERFEQRSKLMKNLLWLPFTLGFPIIRDYFVKRDRKK